MAWVQLAAVAGALCVGAAASGRNAGDPPHSVALMFQGVAIESGSRGAVGNRARRTLSPCTVSCPQSADDEDDTPPCTFKDNECECLYAGMNPEFDDNPEYYDVDPTWSCGNETFHSAGQVVAYNNAHSCNYAVEYRTNTATTTTLATCATITMPCPPGSFFLAPATQTSNTVCNAWSTCKGTTPYQSIAPTTTTDRFCVASSNGCRAGVTWQSTAPTATTDEVCQNVTQCGCTPQSGGGNASTATGCTVYPGIPPTLTSDRICRNCPVDAFASTNASGGTVCTSLTQCTDEAPYQSLAPTLTTDRHCTNVSTSCGVGMYQTVAATATSDEVCGAVAECVCPPEPTLPPATPTTTLPVSTLSPSTANVTTAAPTSAAPSAMPTSFPTPECLTKYESVAPTITSNRVCSPNASACPPESMQILGRTPTNATFLCTPLTQCNGTMRYQSVAPTVTTDRQCTAVQNNCTAGVTWQQVAPTATSSSSGCSRVSQLCLPSQVTILEPTLTSDRVCLERCSPSEYIAENNSSAAHCAPITLMCGRGQFEAGLPIPSVQNRVCDNCSSCAVGSYETHPCTSTTDTMCAASAGCNGSEWQRAPPTQTTARVCAPLTQCTPGVNYQSAGATATTDRVCGHNVTACAAGTFQRVAPTPSSNRLCQNVTVCPFPSAFRVTPATAMTNAVCQNVSSCVRNVSYQISAATPTSNRVCAPVTPCDSLSFVLGPATATSNTQCGACRTCAGAVLHACSRTADTVCGGVTAATGGDSGLGVGGDVGIAVAAMAAVVIVGGVYVRTRRQQQKQARAEASDEMSLGLFAGRSGITTEYEDDDDEFL